MREARVLSQGHLLLQSSDGFHESQRKVYVVLSDATLKCYDEDPTARRDAKLYASYDLRFVKVLDCSESKHPKSFTVEVRSSSKGSQTRLEFISPTNSVKFQWMKQLIGATSSLHNSIKTGGEAARSYAVNIAHHRSSPVAIDSRSRKIFDNPFKTRSLSQYNTSTLNSSLSSCMPHDAIASERASILASHVPKRPHSSNTALIIAPPEGKKFSDILYTYVVFGLHTYGLFGLHTYVVFGLHTYVVFGLHTYVVFGLHTYGLFGQVVCVQQLTVQRRPVKTAWWGRSGCLAATATTGTAVASCPRAELQYSRARHRMGTAVRGKKGIPSKHILVEEEQAHPALELVI